MLVLINSPFPNKKIKINVTAPEFWRQGKRFMVESQHYQLFRHVFSRKTRVLVPFREGLHISNF